jgi:hypothetical protein
MAAAPTLKRTGEDLQNNIKKARLEVEESLAIFTNRVNNYQFALSEQGHCEKSLLSPNDIKDMLRSVSTHLDIMTQLVLSTSLDGTINPKRVHDL